MLLPSPFFTHINTRYLKKHVTKNEKSPGCKAFSVSGPQSWRNEIRKRNSWPCRSSVWLKTCFSIFCWVGSWFYFQEFFKGQFFSQQKIVSLCFITFLFQSFVWRPQWWYPGTTKPRGSRRNTSARRLGGSSSVSTWWGKAPWPWWRRVGRGGLTSFGGFLLFGFLFHVSKHVFFFFSGEAYETEVLRDQRNIQSSSINSWYSNRSLERSNWWCKTKMWKLL